MSYFKPNWNPKEDKNKKTPKQPKQKQPKPPKPEPEPAKELTEQEYINLLIEEKEDIIDKKMNEIEEIQKDVNSLKTKQGLEILLNERRVLVSKLMAKLPKKDKTEDEKKELYDEMIKDIKKFDKHFDIKPEQLTSCDLRI